MFNWFKKKKAITESQPKRHYFQREDVRTVLKWVDLYKKEKSCVNAYDLWEVISNKFPHLNILETNGWCLCLDFTTNPYIYREDLKEK